MLLIVPTRKREQSPHVNLARRLSAILSFYPELARTHPIWFIPGYVSVSVPAGRGCPSPARCPHLLGLSIFQEGLWRVLGT